jgi:hypothetical protein
MLYYIDTGYACFGLVAENGIVIDAAPIARWTLTKKIDYVIMYYKKKGAKVSETPD